MKLTVLLLVVALTSAGRLENSYLPLTSLVPAGLASLYRSSPVPILKLQNDHNGDGTYKFSFETANHIVQQESGQLKSADSSVVRGSYSYVGPDGQTYTVNYVADEQGYRVEGAHLPTPPPVPGAILKNLQLGSVPEVMIQSRKNALSNEYLPSKYQ